ncbi:uncharacterized protein CTRU02_212137 [Colletotrichum truncatum]|uniref:Uncharacterized protein n=1 Tax=Colletotrichum truncatum TaxID=5467 RepID=A0ACC3YMP2_COLTU|nr:uncharacterized protein CTRU02_06791 [Colletotrichum truncatum]KAF6792174.1 hypothetical protein CTRU02_06791 [Colletotrichum truncatum]
MYSRISLEEKVQGQTVQSSFGSDGAGKDRDVKKRHSLLTAGVEKKRIEELGRQDRCSSTSTSTTNASISTRSPPLYYGATPLVAGDDRRMNSQQLPKVPLLISLLFFIYLFFSGSRPVLSNPALSYSFPCNAT